MDRDYPSTHGGNYDGGYRRQVGKSKYMGERILEPALKLRSHKTRTCYRLRLVYGAMDAKPSATLQGCLQSRDREAKCKLSRQRM